jgi:Domain of unknown function (DUF4440)
MKKITLILCSALMIVSVSFGQTKMSKDEKLKAHIIELDIAAWDAWKTKNVDYFRANTTEEFLSVNTDGITNKTQMITSGYVGCDVKSFSLNDIIFIKLNKNAAMLAYTATQDAVCEGARLSPKVRASVTYVRRGGRWLEAFYMETPMGE